MMRYSLTIQSNNEALVDEYGGEEIARILRDHAVHIAHFGTGEGHDNAEGVLFDGNGNTVGEWRLEVEA